jgi:hypothetical protein
MFARTHRTVALLATLALAACSFDDLGDPAEGPAPIRERLVRPAVLDLAGGHAAAVLAVERSGALTDVDLPVVGGSLSLRADATGDLVLDELEIAFDELAIPPSALPPSGLVFEGVRAVADGPTPLVAAWSEDGRRAIGEGAVDLVVHWAVRLESGELSPLAPQRIPAVPVWVRASLDDAGALAADVQLARDGTFWRWGTLVSLADLALALRGAEISGW